MTGFLAFLQRPKIEPDFYGTAFQVEIDQDSLGDQMLPSLYAEDQTNAMNQERRREGESPVQFKSSKAILSYWHTSILEY